MNKEGLTLLQQVTTMNCKEKKSLIKKIEKSKKLQIEMMKGYEKKLENLKISLIFTDFILKRLEKIKND